jgi:hypothetical protein
VLAATHGLVAEAPIQDDSASLVVTNHLGADLFIRWDTTTPTTAEWHDRVPPYSHAVLPVPINARMVKVLVSYASGAADASDDRAVLYTHAAVLAPSLSPIGNGSPAALGDGRKVVTTSGTEVALSTATLVDWLIVQAETDNSDVVVVGTSTVIAAQATRRGLALDPGDSVVLGRCDLAEVYIDAMTNGDGVTFIYGVRE